MLQNIHLCDYKYAFSACSIHLYIDYLYLCINNYIYSSTYTYYYYPYGAELLEAFLSNIFFCNIYAEFVVNLNIITIKCYILPILITS